MADVYGVDRGPSAASRPARASSCTASACLPAAFGSDSVAAVQQAIVDDVNVINFSIAGGANPYTDAVELAFLDAFNAGSPSTPRPATAVPVPRPPSTAVRG